jgi:4-diphosphocytidyl-2-C-methyl-D-erythritol kinase
MPPPPCSASTLWQLGWDEDRLAALGLTLGADVPVFVRGHAALPKAWAKTDPGRPRRTVVSRAGAASICKYSRNFFDPLLTRNSPPIKVRPVPEGNSRNDCLPVVARRYPEVRNALNLLGKFTEAKLRNWKLCVWGFPSKAEADKVSALLTETLTGFVAKGSNVSMLHRKLQSLL